MRKADERAYRHSTKITLNKLGEEAEIFNSAPIGNYYD